jgi:hypothetical protein
MNELEAAGILIGLFVLRCVLPIVVTAGLCILMNRLVARSREEEEAAPEAAPTPVPMPAPITFKPALALPCWLVRNCPEEKRANCPAYQQQGLPCWEARRMVEGVLPGGCPDCPRYAAAQAVA